MATMSPIMNVMIKAAEKAGRNLARDFGEVENLQVSRKGPANFVTAADKRAEEIIFEELKNARPSYSFLMEESKLKLCASCNYTCHLSREKLSTRATTWDKLLLLRKLKHSARPS